MTKTYEAIPAFFWHFLAKEALYNGWDMEEEIYPALESIKDEVLIEYREHTLTCADLIPVSKGNMSGEAFGNFMSAIYKSEKIQSVEDSKPILVSMHSGSSDYFTVGMLKSFIQNH